MPDLASLSAGGRVSFASSRDPEHPEAFVLDGRDDTFWMSTGLYPQALVVKLGSVAEKLSVVRLTSTNIRNLRVESCGREQPVDFSKVVETELEDSEGRLQLRELRCDCSSDDERPTAPAPIRFLRLVVASGWHDFCSVHRVQVVADVFTGSLEPEPSADHPEPGAGSPEEGGEHRGHQLEENADSAEGADVDPDLRRYWLDLVAQDGWRLAEAPESLRNDKDVVLAAVTQDGLALQYASESLRADGEVVLRALNQNPWAGNFMADVMMWGESEQERSEPEQNRSDQDGDGDASGREEPS
eukprot:TRINITY_DN73984_c0_g1_i1.p1 TRINITY_DN73984_c0_g1~~TRINITY_DN73984_c0_g1_i1.p1  ORF type:complete len:300 (+),score=72.08 TRINITY_DN73984_c0_g1_i1:92-991(+)